MGKKKADEVQKVSLSVPFAKIRKGGDRGEVRYVSGLMTTEAVDDQGEVIPFPVALKAMQEQAAYFERVTKATGQEPSKGNVREMHQAKAAGKIVEYDPMEAERQIWIDTEIHDPVAVQKIDAGVYTGFSVAGIVPKRHVETRGGRMVRVYDDFHMTEVSLVDRGSNPETYFQVVKMAAGTYARPALSPADPNAGQDPGTQEPPTIEAPPNTTQVDAVDPNIRPDPNAVPDPNVKKSSGIVDQLRSEIAGLLAPEGEIMKAALEELRKLSAMLAGAGPDAIAKAMSDTDMTDNMNAIHGMGHALTKASSLMGAQCDKCMKVEDGDADDAADDAPTDAADAPGDQGHDVQPDAPTGPPSRDPKKVPAVAGKVAGEPSLTTIDAGKTPGDKTGPPQSQLATPGSKTPGPEGKAIAEPPQNPNNLKIEKLAGETRDLVAKVLASVEALEKSVAERDEAIQKLSRQPAPVGRPVTPADKTLPGQVRAAADPASEVDVLQKMAARTENPVVREALIREAAEVQVRQAQAAGPKPRA